MIREHEVKRGNVRVYGGGTIRRVLILSVSVFQLINYELGDGRAKQDILHKICLVNIFGKCVTRDNITAIYVSSCKRFKYLFFFFLHYFFVSRPSIEDDVLIVCF